MHSSSRIPSASSPSLSLSFARALEAPRFCSQHTKGRGMDSCEGHIDVCEAEEGPSKEKKPRIEEQESSDVSSPTSCLVVENGAVESPGVAAQQLVEMGCSCGQGAYDLRSWGNDTSFDKSLYPSRNEGHTSVLVHEKEKWRHLKDMGFSEEHINAAVKACGKESDIIDLMEFIQAYFCVGDPFLSTESEACLPRQEGCSTTDVLAHGEDKWSSLKDMGFSEEHIDAAIKACGEESDTIDLVEFIQAHFCSSDTLCSTKNEACLPLPEIYTSRDMTLEKDSGRYLINMGFTHEHNKGAMKACGKERSVELAKEYTQSTGCMQDACVQDSSSAMEKEVDSSSEDEDVSRLTPFQKLRNMGFLPSIIENAMETCESLDFEDLLNFLLEADSLYGEDLSVKEVREILPHGSKVIDEASSSKAMSTSIKWTKDKIRLWYSYIGLKKDNFADMYESSGKISRKKKTDFVVKSGGKTKDIRRFEGEVIKPEKMRGFAMPGYFIGRPKPVPKTMIGPPFFYFENVASAPKFEWDTIKRHLHDVEIEYTDAKFFSASRRPRGYVHNLPIDGRRLIIPEPPMTISEAFPDTQKYWPLWDTREKLNCIHTVRASDKLCEMIRALCIEYGGTEMPYQRQQEILQASKKWNLVWVGPGQAAPLEPHEIELLLGFDKDHTRGCSSMTDRYMALGNSFQINTVAYHLSPLRDLYPNGMTVLSLFSGIGGAEVALHKLGIHLKAVIAVEKHPKTKNILASWWRKTNQSGHLIHEYDDVKELSYSELRRIIEDVGTIDLIIGGSPCNNLSGCNRATRTGLEGKHSSLFFEFPRILNIVKQIMAERSYKR